MSKNPRQIGESDGTRPSEETLEARAYLSRAVARLDELSDIDHARLVYLENRSLDNQEATQDLFHAANNALFIMTVYLEILSAHLAATGECEHDSVPRWLGLLRQKTQDIASVNRQLLVVTEPSSSPLYLIHSFISLRVAIQQAIDIYSDVARKKDITIHWTVPDFPAVAIWTDGVALASVLDNILSNAVKFSPPGSTIDVTMRRDGDNLICAVRDEGPGLSDVDLSRLFQRGAILTSKPTGGETSSGYGLAATREVVERLGGRVWCESIKGEGACFYVSLPSAGQPPAVADPQLD